MSGRSVRVVMICAVSWFDLVLVHIGPGSNVHFCPRPCLEHSPVGQACRPLAQKDHSQSVVRALMPTLAVQLLHVCHHQETGPSPLAHTCNRIWTLLGCLQHIGAPPHTRCENILQQFTPTQKSTMAFCQNMLYRKCVFDACFTPGRAPRKNTLCSHKLTLNRNGHPSWANKDAHTKDRR